MISPVSWVISPTRSGPAKDADLSARANNEKNVDSCPCHQRESAHELTAGIISAKTALA